MPKPAPHPILNSIFSVACALGSCCALVVHEVAFANESSRSDVEERAAPAANITVIPIEDDQREVQVAPLKQRKQLRDLEVTYTLKGGGTYTGQWNYRDEPHGQGRYVAQNGDEYVGSFENGEFHGRGVYYYVNGDQFRGLWRKGNPYGQGTMEYKNGNIYEGGWANGLRHGKGVLRYRSGSRYEGDWKLGERHGRGMFVSKSGQRYIGEYAYNKPHGRGTEVESNGDAYTGTFSKGKKHGVGECAPRNGDVTVCLYDRGRRILDPKLLKRAIAYYEKNRPSYEFEGGIGFLFEDHYTKQRRWLGNEEVYWTTIEAMLATQLRIRSQVAGQDLTFVIDDYMGPGTYELAKGKFVANIGKNEAIGLSEGERMTLEITADSKGVIEGSFSATRLVSGEGNATRVFAIRNGQFEAEKYVEPTPEHKDNRDKLREKYLPNRER